MSHLTSLRLAACDLPTFLTSVSEDSAQRKAQLYRIRKKAVMQIGLELEAEIEADREVARVAAQEAAAGPAVGGGIGDGHAGGASMIAAAAARASAAVSSMIDEERALLAAPPRGVAGQLMHTLGQLQVRGINNDSNDRHCVLSHVCQSQYPLLAHNGW